MKKYKYITVWAGAAPTISACHHKPMHEIGQILAQNKITMVYGIGDEGMMGAAFQGVRSKKGKVKGITTPKLLELQCKDPNLFQKGEIEVVDSLSERKRKMMELGEVILAGPGGWGTLDEISNFAVLIQTGEIKKKPLIFLNFNNFWAPFGELIFNMLQEGTLNQDKVDFIDFANSPEELFDVIEKVQIRLDAAKKVKQKK